MTIREQMEALEDRTLSPYGQRSSQSRGRLHPLAECDLRTPYQRDRDRIIHCKSFRRLKHKTQMFLSPEGDHYRTRLTHTLEVSQVARTIARALFLNEDLAEAIALGHDLGHTPFGHIGERLLNKVMPGGFRHQEQSLRVVDCLEAEGEGLNLTWEVRDGIAHHSGDTLPSTLEACVVHLADRIAYINHDIDDAVRAGILLQTDLPQASTAVLGESHGKRIDAMVRDVVAESQGQAVIRMSSAVQNATDTLRAFLFKNVYLSPYARQEEAKAQRLLSALVDYLLEQPGHMPEHYQAIAAQEGHLQAICDFVASMTDRYAYHCYQRWLLPTAFDML